MQTNYALFISLLAIGAAVLICGCTGPPEDGDLNRTVVENLTVGEVLARDGNFSVFVQALDTAGLGGTLAGPGPYTVFAPTDEAFSRVPETAMEELFDDPKGILAETLLYHMAPGRYTATGIAANDTLLTVQGSPIAVDSTGDSVAVNGARIVWRDVPAANGVIHAIDAVMIPPGVILLPVDETAVNVTENETG